MNKLFIKLFIIQSALLGCATSSKVDQSVNVQQWIASAIEYEQDLTENHPDHYLSISKITPEMKQLALEQLHGVKKSKHAQTIARWLVDKDGLAMKYDVESNFSPVEVFENRLGNCLSFTILFINLSDQLGIPLEYNVVDIPDSWGSDQDNSIVYYRHVNAVTPGFREKQIFDLAMENYDARYPQHFITNKQAIGQLHNNRAMQAFHENDFDQAMHYIKLAIALDPQSADFFTNLGSIFKRNNQPNEAEAFYLAALKIEPRHLITSSNLERLYRNNGDDKRANFYAKRALKARNSNPYFLYKKAQDLVEEKQYRQAKKSITRAKKLHEHDSRFFELSSRINQHLGNYKEAVNELLRAYEIATSEAERGRYAGKAVLVAKKAVEQNQGSLIYENGRLRSAR